jgi:hypothetical protein
VMRLLDDGTPPTAIATGATKPRTIAAGPGRVIWAAQGGVWTCDPSACEATKKKLASSMAQSSVRDVAYDGTYVYWADSGTVQNMNQDGKIVRCDPSSGDTFTIAAGQWAPNGLALLDNHVLWSNEAPPNEDGTVKKGPKLIQGALEIRAGILTPTGIAATPVEVYWAEYNPSGRVRRCAHADYCDSTSNVAPELGGLLYPRDVALTGERVYFTTTPAADGRVWSCPLPGCPAGVMPKVHASARPSLHRMAVGATCVFFTDESAGGSVVKVAR